MLKISTCLLAILLFVGGRLTAQDLSTPGGYLDHFSKTLEVMNQTYMNYLSAVSHGKSARKVEKLRNKTPDAILITKGEVAGTPGYKGDKTYRDAAAEYIKICYAVFNEDYHKIVNMEEIAEQSYDKMEAYLLAQEKAGERLKEAGTKQHDALVAFAAKNSIQLIDSKDELDKKLDKADQLHAYYNKIYLIFFKSYKQDMYLTDAVNRSDLNGMEQARNALEAYATAGLEELTKIEAFQSDASVKAACQEALKFYLQLATKNMEPVSNFVLASDNFIKLKKGFDVMPAAKRTQAEVDNYNKAAESINRATSGYNKSNTENNKRRNDMLNQWNNAVKGFFDQHMPYAK